MISSWNESFRMPTSVRGSLIAHVIGDLRAFLGRTLKAEHVRCVLRAGWRGDGVLANQEVGEMWVSIWRRFGWDPRMPCWLVGIGN